jgi:hypothetical protein
MRTPGMLYRKQFGHYEVCQVSLRPNNSAYHSCTVRSLACLLQAISGTTNVPVYTSNRVLQQVAIVPACISMLQLRCEEDRLAYRRPSSLALRRMPSCTSNRMLQHATAAL